MKREADRRGFIHGPRTIQVVRTETGSQTWDGCLLGGGEKDWALDGAVAECRQSARSSSRTSR